MLNQVVFVGRLVKDVEIKETENGNKVSNITIAVPRSFKNSEGVYETDFIPVTLWKDMASNTAEYIHKGDILGIRGRLQTDSFDKDGKNEFRVNVVAEKVSFLSSRTADDRTPTREEQAEEMDKIIKDAKENVAKSKKNKEER